MEDEKKEADKTADQNSTGKTNDETVVVEDVKIDYDKEFQEATESFDRAEKNREGYQKRKAKTEGEAEEDKVDDVQAKADEAVAKAITKALPKLQSSLAEDSVENALNDLAGGNEAKRKLIRFHFENSVGTNGTIRERMENALLITDKKAILKKQDEMATALKNRAGLGASGMGSSTEGQTVPDNILSADQLKDLKGRGWDNKKIERFKENLRR